MTSGSEESREGRAVPPRETSSPTHSHEARPVEPLLPGVSVELEKEIHRKISGEKKHLKEVMFLWRASRDDLLESVVRASLWITAAIAALMLTFLLPRYLPHEWTIFGWIVFAVCLASAIISLLTLWRRRRDQLEQLDEFLGRRSRSSRHSW